MRKVNKFLTKINTTIPYGKLGKGTCVVLGGTAAYYLIDKLYYLVNDIMDKDYSLKVHNEFVNIELQKNS